MRAYGSAMVGSTSRPAFTLVELLVALTILGVGVAAWTSTSALAMRTEAEADRDLAALRLGRETAARLALECRSASGARDGVRWTITDVGAGLRHVRVEVLPDDDRDGASTLPPAEIVAACPP